MFFSFVIIILCLIAEHVTRYLLSDYINITCNTGAAFGIFRAWPEFTLILSGLSCVILLCVMIFSRLDKFERFGLSLILGGALSNLLERIFLGHVIDWIPFPFFDLNFNIADLEISLGGIFFCFRLLILF